MNRRVSLLLTLVAALAITKPAFYARADNPLSTIYVTNVEQPRQIEVNGHLLEGHLMNKNFKDLDHDEFQSNQDLKTLVISSQSISESWLQEKDYLFASPTLDTLLLTGCSLTWLPSSAFARIPNLSFLSLARNHLNSISLPTLESMKQVEALDLSANFFSRFSVTLTLTHLRTLTLTDNCISSLRGIKSKSLVKLDVSGNKIFTIKEDDLVDLPALETLIIARNKLQHIQPLAFAGMSHLTALDLSNNENLTGLSIFEMSQPGHKAYGLFSFDCANCGVKEITPGTFSAMTNLVKLNLAHNSIKILPGRFFENLTSLQSLDLTNNSISWIANGMFVGAESLNFLSLEGNPLKKLSLMPFLKTPRLSKLNVARCGLKHLWDTTNGVLKSLRYFFLAKNSIEMITRPELEVTPNLLHMDITENPFVDDKKFEEFAIQAENKNKLITTSMSEKNTSKQQETVSTQDLNTTTESPKNQTDDGETGLSAAQIFGLVLLFLCCGGCELIFFVLMAIVYLVYWCRNKICKNRQVRSPPDWCNLLKYMDHWNSYKPLREETEV